MKHSPAILGLAAFVTTSVTSLPARAETPGDVRDLVGARAAGGETQLEARGYTFVHVTKGEDRTWANWWNRSSKQCLTVVTLDGRYASITKSPAPDCGQKSGGNSDGTAAAVAVGAAALIGVLALSHKSHNHDDNKHYADSQSEADYERGYRDGLYHQDYHNYSRSDPYSTGYAAGVQQRNNETSYRPNSSRGGYGEYVNLSDIVYQDWGWAQGELPRRGFRQVDRGSNPDGGHTAYYWNGNTRQCVAIATRSSKVTDVTTVKNHNCN
ncbi:hypothetical protein SAMN06295912_14610 [Sphingomonas laterariae]|uniref:Secreted protein n=1 Tax=Edaphosphingomonas laterariae TaxID=861865 RepID=A0A239K6P7_9SPHN|nr:hypothetical protein [Sphingomonas laterariae]SNT13362.1 hypothetical protein SAMN06295912_14610 [Sphingomonas laterariae]